ncbi:cytokine-inducible SH2-containing protein-like [Dunckerocampus dactyliophorus]|uniref:cytokine-inducible SH2-containing protein-like n=1 Tax=Dunckerocampus dactyliophorus TaxID=161453 RepID=UPI002406B29B|nr:cytokine-inducible SH2-containing protein-like [Dunckerocampus dactyliophorus]XP_054640245.1 cytokine-inducible SH2-containing protein-like [Dunckerocampus dactyliophorus]
MILCVPGPRALLPTAPSTEAPQRGMRAGTGAATPCLQSSPSLWDPTKDLRAIASNFCYLETSGWYWGGISAAQAHSALQEASEGAFLVRDSSHPLYMLTLSVKTARGPTSIRIQYSCTRFLLDCSSPARPSLSSFPDVPSLVQHYMGPERRAEDGQAEQRVPSKAAIQEASSSVVLKLKRAVYKPQSLPSLQHLTRLVINRHSDCHEQLPLPRPLLRFLQEYPFKV